MRNLGVVRILGYLTIRSITSSLCTIELFTSSTPLNVALKDSAEALVSLFPKKFNILIIVILKSFYYRIKLSLIPLIYFFKPQCKLYPGNIFIVVM